MYVTCRIENADRGLSPIRASKASRSKGASSSSASRTRIQEPVANEMALFLASLKSSRHGIRWTRAPPSLAMQGVLSADPVSTTITSSARSLTLSIAPPICSSSSRAMIQQLKVCRLAPLSSLISIIFAFSCLAIQISPIRSWKFPRPPVQTRENKSYAMGSDRSGMVFPKDTGT